MKIRLLIAFCVIVIQFPAAYAKAPSLSPEQLVAEHLKSIGEPEALARAKSTNFAGTAEVSFLQGIQFGHSYLVGTSMLVSQGSQMGISMKFPGNNYPGEYFAYDGKSVTVGHIQPGQKSPIADFLYLYNKIMKNGILGGVFSKAWPLLDIKSNSPNMKLRKTKVDRVELYELEYRPKDRHGDMRILMFFDPETYRHILTEYQVSTASTRWTPLTEKFGDFRKVGSLTLPHSYTLSYTVPPASQGISLLSGLSSTSGFLAVWKINVHEIAIDTPNIPQSLFKAE